MGRRLQSRELNTRPPPPTPTNSGRKRPSSTVGEEWVSAERAVAEDERRAGEGYKYIFMRFSQTPWLNLQENTLPASLCPRYPLQRRGENFRPEDPLGTSSLSNSITQR